MVDLDNFKLINDSLGHSAGDELLKVVAERMAPASAPTWWLRLGGDEFVIVLLRPAEDLRSARALRRNCEPRSREPVSSTARVPGHRQHRRGLLPEDGRDAEALLANADAAMYRAKELGRDNLQRYSPDPHSKNVGEILLREEMRQAIARAEFRLLYQPQVDIQTGEIRAVEALIRWNHPAAGWFRRWVHPAAEKTGLIVAIGDWVLHAACRQNKPWQDAGLPPIGVSVNVSARQFREKNLSPVKNALREIGLDPQYLELELTESLIMEDVDRGFATMRELRPRASGSRSTISAPAIPASAR